MKRLVDLVVAALGLVVSSPVQAAIAAAVKADTPGPALFKQERVGKDGRTFQILKFRTMSTGATAASLTSPRTSSSSRTTAARAKAST